MMRRSIGLLALLGTLVAPLLLHAQALISSDPILHFSGGGGQPLAGGKLFTYAAGTTTKLAAFTDVTGTTAHTNPIVLNSRGEPTCTGSDSCGVWLSTSAYKFVLAPADDTDPPSAPIWTIDNVRGSGTSGGAGPPVVGPLTSAIGNIPVFDSAVGTPIADSGSSLANMHISGGTISGVSLTTTGNVVAAGASPVVTFGSGDCGSSPVIVGNDTAGRVTVGSSTNGGHCTLTFATAYTATAPICSVWNETSVARPVYPIGTTTTTLIITASATLTAADKLGYHCIGIQ